MMKKNIMLILAPIIFYGQDLLPMQPPKLKKSKTVRTISYKRNTQSDETIIDVQLDGYVTIGRMRYTENRIDTIFLMQEYCTYNNGEIKKNLLQLCLKDLSNKGYRSAFLCANRDATFYQKNFHAHFLQTYSGNSTAFKLNPHEDLSGDMEIPIDR